MITCVNFAVCCMWRLRLEPWTQEAQASGSVKLWRLEAQVVAEALHGPGHANGAFCMLVYKKKNIYIFKRLCKYGALYFCTTQALADTCDSPREKLAITEHGPSRHE